MAMTFTFIHLAGFSFILNESQRIQATHYFGVPPHSCSARVHFMLLRFITFKIQLKL